MNKIKGPKYPWLHIFDLGRVRRQNEYDIFIYAINAELPKGVLSEILAKVWNISEDEGMKTL